MQKHVKYILIVCLFEGAAVMAVELIGAKMIAPWFGTSLYVWTSVLGVTMLGLASGYYLGGSLSKKKENAMGLMILFSLSGLFIMIMPTSGKFIMAITQVMDVRWGSMISALVFIMPPLLLMGMISPLAIGYCSIGQAYSGRVAGLVFAFSTLGGVMSVLLTGFFFIPYWGLYDSTWFFSGLLLSGTAIVYWVDKFKDRKQWVTAKP